MFDMLRNIFSFYRVTTKKKIVTTKRQKCPFSSIVKIGVHLGGSFICLNKFRFTLAQAEQIPIAFLSLTLLVTTLSKKLRTV